MNEKRVLRSALRAERRAHVASLDPAVRALVFHRPPGFITEMAPSTEPVGLYIAVGAEAPAGGYARWFHENGWPLALPRFDSRGAAMAFHAWRNPFDPDELVPGPYDFLQPDIHAEPVVPGLLIVPLLGFTPKCDRLGQGAGHYDAWLAEHPAARTVGLAWDCQLRESLPVEPHDAPLDAVVTPTRFYRSSN